MYDDPNLLEAAKALLRWNFTAIQSYISNNQTLHIKQLEKKEQAKSKFSRRKEIIKIRTEINEIKTKKKIAKINETKSGSLRR